MRFLLVLLSCFFTFCSVSLLAQAPVNDDCGGVIDLGVAPFCSETPTPSEIYSNLNATATDIGVGNNPTCFNGGLAQRDVWFSFVCSDTLFDYAITIMGTEGPNGEAAMLNPQVALYRGACQANSLAELACARAEDGENMVTLSVDGLTPGITYFLRVDDFSSSATPNWGSFKVCIDEQPEVFLITDGGSTSCQGTLYDSGGPEGDYSNNENNVFTICPNQPSACINLGLTYFNLESGLDFFALGDQLIFYDGPGVDPNTIIAQIDGFNENTFLQSATSGVCYEVQATSGCMTVQFVSDAMVSFSGFEATWECSSVPCIINEPIDVSLTPTENEIIDVLSTPQTQVSITDIDCDPVSYGLFTAPDNSDLGLGSGLLLTSGLADYVVGPNVQDGGLVFDSDRFRPGDVDLDILSDLDGTGLASQDACVVELELIANSNEISFEYVFGSEEYPEFANQNFNDIFAFLVSGEGITGIPEIGNQENIAVLPGTDVPVAINSVNELFNWEYYRNTENSLSVEYDGMTSDFLGTKKSLTARTSVVPCSTYQLKLAIADRFDGLYDSGVFISEISGGSPLIVFSSSAGLEYMIEDCVNAADSILISFNNIQSTPTTFNVTVGGSATPDVDYLLDLPATITVQPGPNRLSFPITVLSDMEDEMQETVIISLSADFGCGELTAASLEIALNDVLDVEINSGQDSLFVCFGADAELLVFGANTYTWDPPALFDDPSDDTPIVSPTESTWISVTGQVGDNCFDTDSIYLQLLDPFIDIPEDEVIVCQGDSVTLTALNNTGGAGITWTPSVGLDNPTGETVTISPPDLIQYNATINLGGNCTATDFVFVIPESFTPATVINDTTICEGYPVTLSSTEPAFDTEYIWSPAEAFDDPTVVNATINPTETTTYTLISNSLSGACTDTSRVTVTVIPSSVDITNPDPALLCVGDTITLNAVNNTGELQNIAWSPDDGTLDTTTGGTVQANPIVSTTYYTNFEVNGCLAQDSVLVRVDSLPADLAIMPDPFEDPYCEGDTIALISPIYEPANFPSITHQWTGPGIQTADSLYNLILITVDTFTYTRFTTSGACTTTEEITINIITDEGVSLVAQDSFLCPGESTQLLANSSQGGEIEWTPTTGLSCTDCLNPTATPAMNQVYTVGFTIAERCVAEASVEIIVGTPPIVDLIPDPLLCQGDNTVPLNSAPAETGVTYSWTADNDPAFASTEAQPIVAPSQTTTYTLTVGNECQPPEEFSVTVNISEPLAVLSVGADTTICTGESFNTIANLSDTPDANDLVNWSYDLQVSSEANNAFIATMTGLATFTYSWTSDTGTCGTIEETVAITVLESPVIDLAADQSFCFDAADPITLNTAPAEAGVTYVWTADGQSFPGDDEANPTVTAASGTTVYALEASNGSCSTTGQVTLTVVDMVSLTPTVNGVPDSTAIVNANNPTVDLGVLVNGDGGDPETFTWTIGGSILGNEPTLPLTINLDDLPALAEVFYTNTCDTLATVITLTGFDYQIPEIFSPNGDNTNDIFRPFFAGDMDEVEITVFNRWGKEVFRSTDVSNPGWDGTFNGEAAPSDVYLYQIRLRKDTETVEEKGAVTLVR